MSLPASVLRSAERVLAESTGSAVRLVRNQPLTEELSVARCWTSGGGTVIVRTHRSRGGWRTSSEYFLNDYAANTLLNTLDDGSLCARLIGVDLAAGVQVTEDLGTGPSLDDLLAGSDPAAAAAGVLAWARALGELHARTLGRSGEYDRLRDGLGSPMPAEHRISLVERPVDAAWTALTTVMGEPAADVSADVARLLAELREPPDGLLALSNGDTCPYNSRILADGVRFLDFELAGFRHCLLDVAYLRVPFPSCYRWGRLPESLRTEAESAYLAAFPLDDKTYRRGLAAACGAWAITRAAHLELSSDRLQVARALAVVDAFAEVARSAGTLSGLAAWFGRLAGRLRERWGVLPEPPLFPAFA